MLSLYKSLCTPLVSGAKEVREGHQIPWKWSYRWFLAAMSVQKKNFTRVFCKTSAQSPSCLPAPGLIDFWKMLRQWVRKGWCLQNARLEQVIRGRRCPLLPHDGPLHEQGLPGAEHHLTEVPMRWQLPLSWPKENPLAHGILRIQIWLPWGSTSLFYLFVCFGTAPAHPEFTVENRLVYTL